MDLKILDISVWPSQVSLHSSLQFTINDDYEGLLDLNLSEPREETALDVIFVITHGKELLCLQMLMKEQTFSQPKVLQLNLDNLYWLLHIKYLDTKNRECASSGIEPWLSAR